MFRRADVEPAQLAFHFAVMLKLLDRMNAIKHVASAARYCSAALARAALGPNKDIALGKQSRGQSSLLDAAAMLALDQQAADSRMNG